MVVAKCDVIQYKMDSHRNSHTNNFKKFLKYVNDKVLRFEIARECELDDICAELMEKVWEMCGTCVPTVCRFPAFDWPWLYPVHHLHP